MLHSVKGLHGFAVAGSDGELGSVKSVYFDDEKWAIRHLVVDAGGWLNERRVLISPYSVLSAYWPLRAINLKLTRRQIRDSPSVDTMSPLSRRGEAELLEYYGYPCSWKGPSLWGSAEFPATMEREVYEETQRRAAALADEEEREHAASRLRGSDDVIGCDVRTMDDTAGHVEDLLFDDQDWSIRLIVVDTRNWRPGKHVLIAPRQIDKVDPDGKVVAVKITREQLERSPELTESVPHDSCP